MGAYDTIVTLARPEDRAGLIAAIFTVGFLALSIPAVIAGIATSHYGLHTTALVYTPVVAVLVATAAGSVLLRPARTARDAPPAVPYSNSSAEPPTIPRTPAEPPRQREATASRCLGGQSLTRPGNRSR
jgi:hypothetical protein